MEQIVSQQAEKISEDLRELQEGMIIEEESGVRNLGFFMRFGRKRK